MVCMVDCPATFFYMLNVQLSRISCYYRGYGIVFLKVFGRKGDLAWSIPLYSGQ
jgi:hypothetical protein